MSRWHADNWSHPSHYLVDPYTWPWSPKGHGHGHEWPTATPFVQCQSALNTDIQLFQNLWPWKSTVKVMFLVKGEGHIWPSKFKGQGYGQGQTHLSHLRPGVQSICLLFILWQSDHFWLRYRKFHIWPRKFKVKVMGKGKPDGHIWGLGVQSICLLFVSWQSDHFWLRYSKFYIWPWKI